MKAWFTPFDADNESTEGSFDEISSEQLYDCATLLALSVVQHRAKYGVVPMQNSASAFRAALAGSGSADMLGRAKQTMREALWHIHELSSVTSDQRRTEPVKSAKLEEKRQQIRISISAPIHVVPPNATEAIKARLENISWGGAALHVSRPVGKVGDCVQIMLPSFRGRRVTVHAEILRASVDPDGQACVVRFSKLRTADERILQQLLELLAASGDHQGQRANARLARRIDIQYDDATALRATLEDISAGGFGVTLPEPMDVGQYLLVAISSTDEQCELLLRARVVRMQEVSFSELQMFRLGLEFGHPIEDIKERVSELIQALATISISAETERSGG